MVVWELKVREERGRGGWWRRRNYVTRPLHIRGCGWDWREVGFYPYYWCEFAGVKKYDEVLGDGNWYAWLLCVWEREREREREVLVYLVATWIIYIGEKGPCWMIIACGMKPKFLLNEPWVRTYLESANNFVIQNNISIFFFLHNHTILVWKKMKEDSIQ